MAGEGAKRRANAKRAQEKSKVKKAARKALKMNRGASGEAGLPTVTENDLLAFQFYHFGDDGQPSTWFVEAETALGYNPAEEDDGLGYYEDGVKRTLTDEQIEMFRHSEVERLDREERLRRGEDDAQDYQDEGLQSPLSDASSIEGELLGLAWDKASEPARRRLSRQQSRACSSNGTLTEIKMRRHEEVPYNQRHKRKWEHYIDENDPVEGSLTHRRMARELDKQHNDSIDLDY